MINKIKNKKIEYILLLIVIFQIFLLINMSVAHSYIIHQSEQLIKDESIIKKNEFADLVNSGVNLLIGFLSIKQIGIVSAQSIGCCMENCIEIKEEACEGNWVSNVCSETTECKPSTCVDQELGTCSAGAPKKICEEDGGEWKCKNEGGECKPIPINEVDECQFGCCTLDNGASKKYVRRIECISKEGSFDPTTSNSKCKIYTQEMGACVLEGGNCKFVTEEDCVNNLGGKPYNGLLCSNSALDTICKKPETEQETKTKCYNDKVYFLDSCDNLANIYDSSRWDDDNYWNSFQEPGFSCIEGENINSPTCGNCDGMNSICGSALEQPNYGDYTCKDLKCYYEDEDGHSVTRQNQESWCVYESHVGGDENDEYSTDVVGSEYRVNWCDRGEIKSELCGNYRGQICGEREIPQAEGGFFSMARCRFNEGFKCLQVEIKYEFSDEGVITNQDEVDEKKAECWNMSDCRVQSIDLYDKDDNEFIIFDACIPKYAPGLEFWESGGNAEDICSLASLEDDNAIPTLWEKGLLKWKCKGNCEALTQDFANQMNDLCISLGDCGGYVNVEGKYTKNFDTFDIDELDEDDYKIKDEYDANGDIDEDKKRDYKANAEDSQIGLGDLPKYFSSTEEGVFGGDPLEGFEWSTEDGLQLFDKIFIVLAGGLAVASYILGLLEVTAAAGPYAWAAAIIIAVIYVILKFFFGIGDTKEIDIEFVCEPWQAPNGGDDCEECNNDPLRPCTEYKCRSLGSGCRLIGEDELYESENPVCVYKYKDDRNPPVIIPKKVGEGYDFFNENNNGVEIRTSNEECIQEFTSINFILKTENENGEDDYAKCVYNWEHVDLEAPDYELEGEEFKEGNFFSVNHTFDERLPFVTDLDPTEIVGDVPGERWGELNMYVRCIDYSGNPNLKEYDVNLCIKEGEDNTIATIDEYNPEDESFLKYGNTTQELTILLDEPANCTWSHESGKSYDEMNAFDYCYLGRGTTGRCITELTGLTESENKVHIKCKDQPWLEGIPEGQGDPWDETNRNVNTDTDDFIYTLYTTENPLEITSILPQGDVIRGSEKIDEDDLEITTSGGMNNGISICKWKFIKSPSNLNSGDLFAQEDKYHKYILHPQQGDYNISIKCWDDAGNEAKENAIFNLKVDDVAPMIVRAYKDGSKLELKTNELAKCYYSSKKCDFNFDDEDIVDITTGYYTKEHSAKWNPSIIYYIKCEDSFGNINSGCAQKIIPSS